MDQRALLEKYERDKKEKDRKAEKEAKKKARMARQKKVRADQQRRAREKKEGAERREREAREKIEREAREKEERESYHFTIERDTTGHFPSVKHKCQVRLSMHWHLSVIRVCSYLSLQIIARGQTMREVYRNIKKKLGIEQKLGDFVVMLMDKKSFEFHEMVKALK